MPGECVSVCYLEYGDDGITRFWINEKPAPHVGRRFIVLRAKIYLTSGFVPALILLTPMLSQCRGLVMLTLGLVVAGVVLNRWNITLSGLVAPPEWSPGILGNVIAVLYFPSLVEIGVALGIIAYAVLGFTLGVHYLEIYPKPEKQSAA